MAFFIQAKCKFIYEQTFYQWKILFVIFQFLHQLYEMKVKQYGKNEDCGGLRRRRAAGRPDHHRLRLGPHHPGYEELWLHRAERRLLPKKPPGGYGGRDPGKL